MSSFRIAIAGLGTVGTGVIKILQKHADLVEERSGRSIEIVAVSAKSKDKDRGVDLSEYDWVDNPVDLADRDDVDAVVELIGGSEGVAKELVEHSIMAGKKVVTANKALIAHHGLMLAELGETHHAPLMFEAAVAGGIPIIKAIREGFSSNDINGIYGILNGTCNYILTTMRETGKDFAEVLTEAQEKGYAEADPSFDVDGIDTAHKLSILSGLSFQIEPDFNAMEITGITGVSAQDIRYAGELGYRIKLLGIAKRYDDRIVQVVEPCLVSEERPLGAVDGVFNAVMVEGDFVDTGLLIGKGAGEGPTATAVVADIIDLARGSSMPLYGVHVDKLSKPNWMDAGEMQSCFYMRLTVLDKPGVLADITAIMRDYSISMEAVLQRGRDPDKPVSIVITTHTAKRANIKEAVAKIADMDASTEEPCLLRIERFKS